LAKVSVHFMISERNLLFSIIEGSGSKSSNFNYTEPEQTKSF